MSECLIGGYELFHELYLQFDCFFLLHFSQPTKKKLAYEQTCLLWATQSEAEPGRSRDHPSAVIMGLHNNSIFRLVLILGT